MLNEKLTCKRAAMFGLDARIALAIFGALSVISGAALYSAIQNSKAVSTLTEMREVIKAWESYLLDTGSDMALDTSDSLSHHRDASDLVVDPGVAGWNGPYLPNTVSSIKNTRLTSKFNGNIAVTSVSRDIEWGLGHATRTTWASGVSTLCDNTTVQCYTAVQFTDSGAGELDFSLASAIDEMVDVII